MYQKLKDVLSVTAVWGIWLFLLFAAVGTAAGEVQIGDAVAPMKIEINAADADSNGMISKTVSLRNTGSVPLNYIFYAESGRDENAAALLTLSATAASVAPGDRYDLHIRISKNEIEKYGAEDLEGIKLKIVRNPETQTPVGYILPVSVRPDDKTGNGTNGEKTENSGKTENGKEGITEKATEKATEKTEKTEGSRFEKENGPDGGSQKTVFSDGSERIQKSGSEKRGQLTVLLAFGFILVMAGGLYTAGKRKKR